MNLGLPRQPLAVVCGQVVVAEEASFEAGYDRGPLGKFAGCGRDGETERGALWRRSVLFGAAWGLVIWR